MPVKESIGLSVPVWLTGPAWPAGHPVRIGVPLPRAALRREEMVQFLDATGRPVPLQTEVLARWPDESIQWLLVDFWAYKTGPERQCWQLQIGRTAPQSPAPTAAPPDAWLTATPPCREDITSIRLQEQGPLLWVDTGPMLFGLDQRHLRPIRWVRVKRADSSPDEPNAQKTLPPAGPPEAELQTPLQLANGRVREAVIEGWRIESSGPVRLTLRTEGYFPRSRGLRVRARMSFFAGTGLVCYQLSVHNPRRARHRGGLWDLGDPGSVLFKDLSVWVRLTSPAHQAAVRIEPAGPLVNLESTVRKAVWQLYQDSSGGPNWQSPNHVNRHGRVPCRLPGYEVSVQPRPHLTPTEERGKNVPHHPAWLGPSRPLPPRGETQQALSVPPLSHQQQEGKFRRALPVAAVQTEHLFLALAVPEFWQQFPKTLQIEPQAVRVALWPGEWDDLHELQGGERKTHTIWLEFAPGEPAPAEPPASSKRPSEQIGPEVAGSADSSPSGLGQETLCKAVDRLAWVHEPIQVVLPPEVWGAAGVLEYFTPSGHELACRLDALLAEAIDGPDSLLARREIIDEYGWRHYGDLYADHENTHYPGPKPVVSHYNNQFDVIYGAILQEARSGNPAWRAVYDPLARHVMDIDLYHTQQDRPAYNGGLFWPTDHYKTAHTATHRTYSRQNQPPDGSPYGGGPGAEHNYATGLLYYYYLTGNPDAQEAVVQLAEWVLQMDDGSQTPWGILDPGPTGLASATRSADYHGPGRGAANSIQTLLDAWQISRHRKYLAKAEELIRRTIHPADHIASRRLLDAEDRWSYTMYLAALARYLAIKIQQNELDGMYRYGQAALVHYGQWMAEQERPYLDHPDQLEYVTEAWAVQELRKANAMRMIARHAEEPLRDRLLERAEELADRAWSDWAGFPNRMSTRALAVLLVEGVRDAYYRAVSEPPAPRIAGPKHFGPPVPFVPQRERVRRLLRQPAGWVRLVWALANPAKWFRLIGSLWQHRN